MKTPTLEEVKEYFKNAKEVKGLHKQFNISEVINTLEFDNSVWKVILNCGYIAYVWTKEKGYAEIISYIEPTTKVRNSVLLQLADNNSYSEEIIRKECPKLFIPTDIIEIVEKYGKDKVISLIEKM